MKGMKNIGPITNRGEDGQILIGQSLVSIGYFDRHLEVCLLTLFASLFSHFSMPNIFKYKNMRVDQI